MTDFDLYKTIKEPSEGIFKDRGSKFLSFAYPVHTEAEFKVHLQELKKRFYDARHHVYAFRMGADYKFYRASDDGEPSNSSGPHVLGQIQSFELTNVMIVVVRYFGGTKLGVPGLVNAYKTAAAEALKNAEIIELTENGFITIQFAYPEMNKVMKIIKDENLNIISQNFQLSCEMQVSVRLRDVDRIKERLTEAGNISATINENL